MHRSPIFGTKFAARHFCISSINESNYTSREGRFIKKLMHGNKSKRKWYTGTTSSSIFPKVQTKTLSVHTVRRMTVLNTIFMEHVTDLMSTGEIHPEILNRSIEISHVKVSADFKNLSIYWIKNDIETHSVSTEDLLRECALRLRHELSQLRVIGNVPPIHFVRCKYANIEKEIEEKLKIADYGEDFEPSFYPHPPSDIVTYKYNVEDNTETEEKVQGERSKDMFSVTIPVMRHDVFGLDHHKIMSKIKASVNKSREAIKRASSNNKVDTISSNKLNVQNMPKTMTAKEQQEQFSEFLRKRQKEEKRRYKAKYGKRKNCDALLDLGDDDHEFEDYTEEYDDYYIEDDVK